jgi:hypothetical protein
LAADEGEQIGADPNGSIAAAIVQYAPIGAKTCTHIAMMTTGKNFPNCRRIEFSSRFTTLLNVRVRLSRYPSADLKSARDPAFDLQTPATFN